MGARRPSGAGGIWVRFWLESSHQPVGTGGQGHGEGWEGSRQGEKDRSAWSGNSCTTPTCSAGLGSCPERAEKPNLCGLVSFFFFSIFFSTFIYLFWAWPGSPVCALFLSSVPGWPQAPAGMVVMACLPLCFLLCGTWRVAFIKEKNKNRCSLNIFFMIAEHWMIHFFNL